jgi:hypothetical protein
MLFFAATKSLGIVWMAVFHIPRGVIGAILVGKLPKSHDIVSDLEFDDIPAAQMSVEKVADKVKFSLSVQFMNMAEENRKWLMLYTVLTGICYLFDALTFVIVLKWFSVAGKLYFKYV